ncbi:ABC-2 type transport system permease protein [Thermolongibacillus altinsuensis]|jgi:ABC-2 type transport system permease protein|uniref:ABC-2 type transport system permease protein n=1 Tax=Thermolongibacillus altinsuensis TaxID=575256 RepID=A0A4R1QD56_9BACL|nr:ABC transporter permease [Thermolongibacillus altinsuensis]TCL48450.1 ABC-2 type transport system permease protein [Thermolongibacillus altinsuensis]GMB08111.1 ABC transporter permease [Thermolongibacillus altinsuensis]
MIFKREFKRNIKSLIIWSIVLGSLILLTLSIFPQFAEQQKEMTKLLESLPESMIKAFGLDQLNIGDLMGYYGVRVYAMTTLLGSIYSAILASNILAKEENEKTIEFLLSKPITRSQIVTEKLFVVLVNIFILNGVSTIASIIGFQFTKDQEVPTDTFTLLIVAAILLHLTFAALAFMLSSIMKKTRNILSVSLGVVLVTYFMNILSGISEDIEFLKYFSPFKYVDPAPIINDNAIEPLYIFVMAAVILISIVMAYMVYRKKDIAV